MKIRCFPLFRPSLLGLLLVMCAAACALAQDGEAPWNRLYVTNLVSNDVSVIDLTAGQILATIPVGQAPTGIVVSPDLQQVYVANHYSGTISIISTGSNEVIETISVPCECENSAPFGLALTPDGAKLYVTHLSDGTVRVFDTASKELIKTIHEAYDWALRYIAISPDGTRAWALGTGEGKISVIDTFTDEVVAVIHDLPSARAMAFTPDGTRAYVVAEKYSCVYVLNTETLELITTIHFPPGSGTITVAMAGSGKFAIVSNFFGSPSLIDTDPASPTYHEIIAQVPPASSYEYCIMLSPDDRFAYLSNQADRGPTPNSINIIDLDPESETRHQIIKSIPVGIQPWGICVVKQPSAPEALR
jgi:YVTN family beta-propeller protein